MKRILNLVVVPAAALLMLLTGCGGESVTLLNENETAARGDFYGFVSRGIQKYRETNTLASATNVYKMPVGPCDVERYVYFKDKDGIQVACRGDKLETVYRFFKLNFGAAAMVKSNETRVTYFIYSLPREGIAVQCGASREKLGASESEITRLTIVKQSALR
jgi:hypothetical protein